MRSSTYQKISYEDRLALIEAVCKKGHSIKTVSREMAIHPSTARMIIVKYKTEGRIF